MDEFRGEIIETVKKLKITPQELGVEPEVRYKEDKRLIEGIRNMIDYADISAEDARAYIPEEYWKEVGIEEIEYSIVEVTMYKTVRQTIRVAVESDKADDDEAIYEAIGDLTYLDDNPNDDEDDWAISDSGIVERNLTADDVKRKSNLYNEEDFI